MCYDEDSRAEVDLNVVMTDTGHLIEVQGTAEVKPFSRETLDSLLEVANEGGPTALRSPKEGYQGARGGYTKRPVSYLTAPYAPKSGQSPSPDVYIMSVSDLFGKKWNGYGSEKGTKKLGTPAYLAKWIVHDFLTYNCPHMAASIAFWGFFSIFPMVLAVVLITGGLLSYDAFIERLGGSLPVSQEFVTDNLNGVTETWPYTGFIAVIGLVWASLAVFSAIRKGLNAAWGVTKPRPFFRERLIDFGLMMLAWLAFVISVSITPVIEFSRNTTYVGRFIIWDGYWALFRVGLPWVLTFWVFMVLYRFIPNTHVRWRDVWPGALIASISFEVLRHGFVWYVGKFSIYKPYIWHGSYYGGPPSVGLFLRRNPIVR